MNREPASQNLLSRIPATTVTVVLALLTALAAVFGTLLLKFAWIGLLASVAIGQLVHVARQQRCNAQVPAALQRVVELSRDPAVCGHHDRLAESLTQVARYSDPLYRKLALERLSELCQQSQTLAGGTIEFASTERWRVAYEQLLRSPTVQLYRSIARIESVHYWQDGPGQQSTQLNLELQNSGTIAIERTAILADHLWPADDQMPVEPVHGWLDEQHRRGIWIGLVRESALQSEPELVTDLGIYGNRAVGLQLADPAGRTVRFLLSFDFHRVRDAEEIWARLGIYSVSYRQLLDQLHRST